MPYIQFKDADALASRRFVGAGALYGYFVCVSEWTRMCAGMSHAMEWKAQFH